MKGMLNLARISMALASGALCVSVLCSQGQAVSDFAVQVSAVGQTNPARITLSWPLDAKATGLTLYRKSRDDTSWGSARVLAVNATDFTDTNVVVGGAYEYRVAKSAPTYYGEGYVYAGVQVPLVESRGKVVLMVDSTHSASLAYELARLQQDLVGDGWTVVRHDVARMAVDPSNNNSSAWAERSNELANVKGVISADYNAAPANITAVFVIGHIPVSYSGNLAPDGHVNHVGAWPADGFYGSMNQLWPDFDVDDALANSPRNWNVPGDGKLDTDYWPFAVLELAVGRVDLANLPAFPEGEGELLRRYLNKDHNFRNKLVTAGRRGLIDDHLGLSTGEPLAAGGWRNFAAFFGASNTFANPDWFGALSSNTYLWGYGCGGGSYTSCAGVGNTADFAVYDPKVVFTLFFGSYFGDWDSQDNFMRAALGTPTFTLTSAWSGRPHWVFHHMALGETIGFSTRLTQNNTGTYDFNNYAGSVHIALMGDPTLRMHIVAPPAALAVESNGAGGVELSWNSSPDAVLGYHVYRAATAAGPFTRLNTNLIATTSYTDPEITTNVYMVRAVKLEVSGSGSYYNASQGIFQSLDGSAGSPIIALRQPTNGAVFFVPTNIALAASTFDPANCITNVTFYANGLPVGNASGVSQSATWSNATAGSYSLTARAFCSSGLITNSGPATVMVVGERPTLAITPLGSTVQGSGDGVPGRAYRILFVNSLADTNWQTLMTVTSSSAGLFQFSASGSSTQKFFRSVYP